MFRFSSLVGFIAMVVLLLISIYVDVTPVSVAFPALLIYLLWWTLPSLNSELLTWDYLVLRPDGDWETGTSSLLTLLKKDTPEDLIGVRIQILQHTYKVVSKPNFVVTVLQRE